MSRDCGPVSRIADDLERAADLLYSLAHAQDPHHRGPWRQRWAKSPNRRCPALGALSQRHWTSPVSGSRGFEEPGNVERIATHSDHYVIADNQGRRCGEVLLLHVGDLNAPAQFAGVLVERDQKVVRRLKEQPVSIDADTAIPDVDTTSALPLEMPKLAAGTSVDSPAEDWSSNRLACASCHQRPEARSQAQVN